MADLAFLDEQLFKLGVYLSTPESAPTYESIAPPAKSTNQFDSTFTADHLQNEFEIFETQFSTSKISNTLNVGAGSNELTADPYKALATQTAAQLTRKAVPPASRYGTKGLRNASYDSYLLFQKQLFSISQTESTRTPQSTLERLDRAPERYRKEIFHQNERCRENEKIVTWDTTSFGKLLRVKQICLLCGAEYQECDRAPCFGSLLTGAVTGAMIADNSIWKDQKTVNTDLHRVYWRHTNSPDRANFIHTILATHTARRIPPFMREKTTIAESMENLLDIIPLCMVSGLEHDWECRPMPPHSKQITIDSHDFYLIIPTYKKFLEYKISPLPQEYHWFATTFDLHNLWARTFGSYVDLTQNWGQSVVMSDEDSISPNELADPAVLEKFFVPFVVVKHVHFISESNYK